MLLPHLRYRMAEGGVKPGGPGTDLSADRRSLLVHGLTPEISTELLELYFENYRYGGGDIESITMDTEDAVTIIFKKPEGKFFYLCFSNTFILSCT